MLESLLSKRGPEVINKILELGLAGDAACLRICAERLIPPRKSSPIKFKLPPLRSIADAQAALSAIIAGTANGTILADEAATLSSIIASFVRTVEVSEIEGRRRSQK